MSHLQVERSNAYKQKMEWWFSGAVGGENGEMMVKVCKAYVTQDK